MNYDLPQSVGKTHMVQRVGDFLSSFGCWIVARTKFKRGAEHESRQCISSLFDGLIASIVAMKDCDNEADVTYSRRLSEAISATIDRSSLVKLTEFIPSMRNLIVGYDREGSPSLMAWEELKSWQLT